MTYKKISHNLIILMLILMLTACGASLKGKSEQQAEPKQPTTPKILKNEAATGSNSDFLADYTAFIAETQQQDNIPGVAVAVVRGDETILAQGLGYGDVETQKAVTPETLFHIGSTHKSLTAMMMATLIDEGLFTWDTPVVEIYPDFELADPNSTRTVTIRHLLSMRSGIPAEAEDDFDFENAVAEDVFEHLRDTPLRGKPGDEFSYSNLSNASSGYVGVLAVKPESLDLYEGYIDLLQERVLDPIGMKNAVVRASEAQANPHYSKSYYVKDGEPIEAESYDIDGDALAPAGSLKANVQEMALYISSQLNQGLAPNGTRVVSAKNLSETWQPYLENYGMGWETSEHEGVKIISHEGSYDNYLSVIGFMPDLNLGFVILTNSEDAAGNLISAAPLFLADLCKTGC